MSTLLSQYENLLTLVEKADMKFIPKMVYKPTDDDRILEACILDVHEFISIHHKFNSQDARIPSGAWHMYTLTSPSNTIEECKEFHDIVLGVCARNNVTIYIAALEKASHYHIHYTLCGHGPKGIANFKRDVTNKIKCTQRLEKKCKSLLKWHGLLKYCTKDGYIEKADTQVELIINRVRKVPGEGWKIDGPDTDLWNPT